jgi:hypothetical protein
MVSLSVSRVLAWRMRQQLLDLVGTDVVRRLGARQAQHDAAAEELNPQTSAEHVIIGRDWAASTGIELSDLPKRVRFRRGNRWRQSCRRSMLVRRGFGRDHRAVNPARSVG